MGVHGAWLPDRQPPDPRATSAVARRGGTFARYLPARLVQDDPGVLLTRDVREHALEVAALVATTTAAVDERTRLGIFPLLLRSESIASSQIERVVATPRDVAYAQLGDGPDHLRDHRALDVARNVDATRRAIEQIAQHEGWTTEDIEEIHRALGVRGVAAGLRTVDVWIGGPDRLRADYVAPPPAEVPALVADLLGYVDDSGEHPLLLAAVSHAQLETIHPFEDGNGRVGRALVHAILERGGVVRSGLLPVSTVVRRREDEYVARLTATRTDNPDEAVAGLNAWVAFFTEVAEEAAVRVAGVHDRVRELDQTLTDKAAGLRAGSSARRALPLLLEQPVVTAAYVADRLEVSRVAAHGAIDKLVNRGVLTPGTGKYKRSETFQADDVLRLLDDSL